ncbi:hypothetical protein [Streptomyces sp. NPDC008121]
MAVLFTRAVAVVVIAGGRVTAGKAAEVTVPPLAHPDAVMVSSAP